MFRNGSALAALSAWLVLAGAALSACDAPRAVGPAIGEAVSVELASLEGDPVTSAAWRGKTVVLNVWASWCGPCRAEMASLEALSRAADPERLIVVGISVDDDRNLAREYVLRERIGFANLLDVTREVSRQQLGVQALPTTLVLGPDGRLRARVAGAKDWVAPGLLENLGLRGLLR